MDECNTENGGCDQNCTNNDGSFLCSCSTGYTLADDDLGCDGKKIDKLGSMHCENLSFGQMLMNVPLEMEVVITIAPTTMVLSCALVVQDILSQKMI